MKTIPFLVLAILISSSGAKAQVASDSASTPPAPIADTQFIANTAVGEADAQAAQIDQDWMRANYKNAKEFQLTNRAAGSLQRKAERVDVVDGNNVAKKVDAFIAVYAADLNKAYLACAQNTQEKFFKMIDSLPRSSKLYKGLKTVVVVEENDAYFKIRKEEAEKCMKPEKKSNATFASLFTSAPPKEGTKKTTQMIFCGGNLTIAFKRQNASGIGQCGFENAGALATCTNSGLCDAYDFLKGQLTPKETQTAQPIQAISESMRKQIEALPAPSALKRIKIQSTQSDTAQ